MPRRMSKDHEGVLGSSKKYIARGAEALEWTLPMLTKYYQLKGKLSTGGSSAR